MFASLTRNVKRFIILMPGLVIGYFAYADIFPAIDLLLPDELALIATYVLGAYVLIPIAIRLFRWFVRPTHLPLYSTTPDGFASDPLNIGVVGTRAELIRAMKKAGWHKADERTPATIFRLITSIVFRKPYPTAPFSALYLFGRKQDVGFELPVSDDPSNRHHVRFWGVSHTNDPDHIAHVSFWRRIHKTQELRGRMLWVGAASLDTGLGIIRHNAQLTHMIHPDTNAERKLIAKHLQVTDLVKRTRTHQVGKPYKLSNRVINGYLKSDGKMTILELQ